MTSASVLFMLHSGSAAELREFGSRVIAPAQRCTNNAGANQTSTPGHTQLSYSLGTAPESFRQEPGARPS